MRVMIKKYKYQIYGIIGIMLATTIALGSSRSSDHWVNKYIFNVFGLEVSKTQSTTPGP